MGIDREHTGAGRLGGRRLGLGTPDVLRLDVREPEHTIQCNTTVLLPVVILVEDPRNDNQ